MSVLIKGMEMPKDCNNCKFFDDNYDYPTCSVTDNSRGYNWNPRGQRMPDCPLVPVPSHGDLIDRGKLREKEFIHDGDAYAAVMSRDIRNAPTIIPAEESNMDSFIRIFEEDDEEDGMDSFIRILKD